MTAFVPCLHPGADVVPLGRMSLQDLDALHLLLRGSSVVDWFKLHLETASEIVAFIRVNGLDADDAADRLRIAEIHARAVQYLTTHLRYRLPKTIANPRNVAALFDYASGRGRRSERLYACLALKVMHIIHYVEAHELFSMLPISNEEIAILMAAKIEHVVRGLLERKFPIVEFSGNQKSYSSVLSKLLAKQDTQAARVFDRLRFRLVVERVEDIPPLLLALTRELVPFNYLVPGQAENSLVDLDPMLARAGNLTAIRAAETRSNVYNEGGRDRRDVERKNELSGPNYRIVNFVSEIPLRIDRVVALSGKRLEGLGPVVFVTAEFQVVDELTAKTNELGDNRHALYKQRQRVKVKERLEGRARRRDMVDTATEASSEPARRKEMR